MYKLYTSFLASGTILTNMNYISTIGLLKQGWETVKAHFAKIVGATAILFVVQTLLDKATRFDEKTPMDPQMGIVMLIGALISLFLGVFVTSSVIRIVRGAKINTQLFSITLSQILRYVGVVVLLALITIIIAIPVTTSFVAIVGNSGLSLEAYITTLANTPNITFANLSDEVKTFFFTVLIALLVWLYVNIRLMFATYFAVDGKVGVFESIKGSWRITRGNVWTMIKLVLLSFVLVVLGFIALFVGLLVAVPVIAFAYAHLYVYLADHKGKGSKAASKKDINE